MTCTNPAVYMRSGKEIVFSKLFFLPFVLPSMFKLPPTLVRQSADISESVVVRISMLLAELQFANSAAVKTRMPFGEKLNGRKCHHYDHILFLRNKEGQTLKHELHELCEVKVTATETETATIIDTTTAIIIKTTP